MKRFPALLVGFLVFSLGSVALADRPTHSGDRVIDWIDGLTWPDSDVREGSAKALASAGDDRAVKPLIKALRDEAGQVREAASWSLGELGAVEAVEPLSKVATKDRYSPARAAAVTALGKLGDAKGAAAIKKALGDRADRVRSAAAGALPRVSKDSGADLRGLLGDKAWQVRLAACAALGEAKSGDSTDALVNVLASDSHDYVRAGAAKALGRIGAKNSVAALQAAAGTDSSQRVRQEANIALGIMKVPATKAEPAIQPTGEIEVPDSIDL